MVWVTWWLEDLPSSWLHRLSDQALLDSINKNRSLCRMMRRGAETPTVGKMWEGSLLSLHVYGSLLAMEANHKRGLDVDAFSEFATPGKKLAAEGHRFKLPDWHRDEDVQISHIAAMHREGLWRSPGHAIELDEEEMFWPVLWPVTTTGGYQLMVAKKDREAMERDDLFLPDDVKARVVNL